MSYADHPLRADELAHAIVLPAVCQSAELPAVHVHAIYTPSGSRFWIATISNYQPGDREAETEFLTVLCGCYMAALRDGPAVARAINNNCGRPSRAIQ